MQKGYCVRTVYITAGDAGGGQFYWLGESKARRLRTTTWMAQVVTFGYKES